MRRTALVCEYLAVLAAIALLGCGSQSKSIASLTVTATSAKVPVGLSQQFVAMAVYSDQSAADVTGQATWSVSDDTVLRLSKTSGAAGVVAAIHAGAAKVTASIGGQSASLTVTATPPVLQTIAIGAASTTMASKTQQQLSATGIYSDGSKQDVTTSVTWSTSDPLVATVTGTGAVQAVGPGLAAINAAIGKLTGAQSIRVSPAMLSTIQVDAPTTSLAMGSPLQLTATGIFSDRSNQLMTENVQWTSSDPQIADVSNFDGARGLVTPYSPGVVTIRASALGVAGVTQLTVTRAALNSLLVQPNGATVITGTTQQYKVFGVYSDGSKQELTTQVAWSTDAPSIASVSNGTATPGLLQGLAAGQVKVVAMFQGKRVSTFAYVQDATLTSIAVTPDTLSMPGGLSKQLTATGTYSNGMQRDVTAEVSWTSSAPDVVAVGTAGTSSGLATSTGTVGTATITAAMNAVTATATVTITAAVVTSINLMPMVPSMANGTVLAFQATGAFSDGFARDLTPYVTWMTTDPSIASVSNAQGSRGLVQANGVGTATITATWNNQSGSTAVTVTSAQLASLAISPDGGSVPLGGLIKLQAIGTYTDGSTQDITTQVVWTSSAPETVSVSNDAATVGTVTAVAEGEATIIAAINGVSQSTTVTVTGANPP